METRQRILLYGDTLMLAGLRASLESDPAFDMIVLDAMHAAPHDLLALNPDIVIFDTQSVPSQFQCDLIQQWEGLLIGIDPGHNRVLLWTGQHKSALSVQDLVEIIHQHPSPSDPFKRDEK